MTGGEPEHRERRRSPKETARLVVSGVLLLVLILFVADNRRDVKVGLIFDDRKLPMIAVMVLFAVAGGVFTLLVTRRRGR